MGARDADVSVGREGDWVGYGGGGCAVDNFVWCGYPSVSQNCEDNPDQ